MPLIQVKCTNCGANIQANNASSMSICPYCGTAYIVKETINDCNIANNTCMNSVNIYGGNNTDFIIRSGVIEKYVGEQQEISIPSNVIIIGREAFADCRGLKKVSVPSNVEEIEDSAFSGCDRLVDVELSEGLAKIGHRAFANCKNLKSIIIPSSVKTIENSAFSCCHNLKYLHFMAPAPISIEFSQYGSAAFECTGITQISSGDNEKLNVVNIDSYDLRTKLFEFFSDHKIASCIDETPLYKLYKKEVEAHEKEIRLRQEEAWKQQRRCTACGSQLTGLLFRTCPNPECRRHWGYK